MGPRGGGGVITRSFGIGNYPVLGDNTVTNNKVRGYDTPYDGVSDSRNKAIPDPPGS